MDPDQLASFRSQLIGENSVDPDQLASFRSQLIGI